MGLTQERLKQLLSYDPLTGVFLWNVSLRGRFAKAGAIAGGPDQRDGYIIICVDQKLYRAHRLAWFYMTGKWPVDELDHIDLDKTNNSFANLREVTKSQNMMNVRCRRNSGTGVKGVQFDARRNRFYATIKQNGKKTWLGYHQNLADAAAAYSAAAQQQHQQFARTA